MTRSVIVVATAIVIVIAGLIISIAPWETDPPRPPRPQKIPEIDDRSPRPSRPRKPQRAQPARPTQSVTRTEAETVSVSINAIPWARVFIKFPENDYFIEPRPRDFTIPPKPNQKESNVTPIPGDLKVPSGTAIKLMYRDKEKIFLYEKWKDGKTISHDFLNQ
ncbi:hypothetical protein C6502_10985 [Candidatus Poribacteria bacterium]|nr:MAG: hypothetical protein C6502_10985 [Candidatus Poribacteria bacterium]